MLRHALYATITLLRNSLECWLQALCMHVTRLQLQHMQPNAQTTPSQSSADQVPRFRLVGLSDFCLLAA
jgi:hypothetical protein